MDLPKNDEDELRREVINVRNDSIRNREQVKEMRAELTASQANEMKLQMELQAMQGEVQMMPVSGNATTEVSTQTSASCHVLRNGSAGMQQPF